MVVATTTTYSCDRKNCKNTSEADIEGKPPTGWTEIRLIDLAARVPQAEGKIILKEQMCPECTTDIRRDFGPQ